MRHPDLEVIQRVEMQYHKPNNALTGLRFIDYLGNQILETGRFENDSHAQNNPDYGYKEFILEEGERLIGMVSRAGNNCARH